MQRLAGTASLALAASHHPAQGCRNSKRRCVLDLHHAVNRAGLPVKLFRSLLDRWLNRWRRLCHHHPGASLRIVDATLFSILKPGARCH